MVRGFANGIIGMDAGDEGFVVAGRMGPYGEPGVPFAIASADGSEWFESAAPPTEVVDVAALEGDWIALSAAPPTTGSRGSTFVTWESANGLDWSRAEEIRFHDSGPARSVGCWLEPSLAGAGRYSVVRSYRGGLCSEGGAVSYGPHGLALDGRGWHQLELTPTGDSGRGAWVASAVFNGRLILAGESNGQGRLLDRRVAPSTDPRVVPALAHLATLPPMVACGGCGTQSPDGFRFCPVCGLPLADASDASVTEERRVVTALFCDLVGFTSSSEAADPEDVDRMLSGYAAMARREIERHGGVVEKFIGDAVVGVFGIPVTHEDDALRAVRGP